MKKRGLLLIFVLGGFLPCNSKADEFSQADRQRASYGYGYNIGRDFRVERMPMNLEQLFAGIKDGFLGKEPKISKKSYDRSIAHLNTRAEQSREEYLAEQGTENLKKGREFMALNAKRTGVKTLKNGLQVEVLKSGGNPNDRHPDSKDLVRARYRGSLINGETFDSTAKDGPVWLPVGGVVPGFTQALKMMRAGDKWRIVIPPQLAYGKDGNPPNIGPMSVLIFEVEILQLRRIQTKQVGRGFPPRN